jgi:hypothetical protein
MDIYTAAILAEKLTRCLKSVAMGIVKLSETIRDLFRTSDQLHQSWNSQALTLDRGLLKGNLVAEWKACVLFPGISHGPRYEGDSYDAYRMPY